jgi:WD40 repeat protein
VVHPLHRTMISTEMLRTCVAVASACLIGAGDCSAQQPTITASLVRTITAHRAAGRQLTFSPDGILLATSSVDSTVKLWRVADGKLIRTLQHPEGVTAIAFSPDGQMVASASYDGKVRLWRVSDGALTRTLAGHTGTVWSVAYSPDGARIASSGEDRTVRLWRAIDGTLTNTLRGHALNVWSVAFSPDGQLLGTGSFDKTIKLWRVETGALVRTLIGSKEAVVDIDFSPDGRLIASGGDDAQIRLWRVADGTVVKTLSGSDHVYSVAFSRDGKWLASGGRARGNLATLWQQFFGNRLLGGNGKTVRLWRVSDGALQQELSAHSDDVSSVALSPDGKWLASSGEDHRVSMWRLTATPR